MSCSLKHIEKFFCISIEDLSCLCQDEAIILSVKQYRIKFFFKISYVVAYR